MGANRIGQHGRFGLRIMASGDIEFADRLRTTTRVLPSKRFSHASSTFRRAECVRLGFMDATLPPALRPIADRPRHGGDLLFWQFPARTEAAAFELHQELAEAPRQGDTVHAYLGLPWATWIDLGTHESSAYRGKQPAEVGNELLMQRVRIGGLRKALQECGVQLRIHTVCQHIHWRLWLPAWRSLGITDLWLSHAPADAPAEATSMTLHPWRLYAVNVEDDARRVGLQNGRDPAHKPLLASFVGAYADHYVSDVRVRLRSLADVPRFHVHVTDKWHFESTVYEHQIGGGPLANPDATVNSVRQYNELLSDSVFALCPAGAGPNTLRLWEALAVGSVPVLLGPAPQFPKGGSLPEIDWNSIVLHVEDSRLHELPSILSSIPTDEVRRRQAQGMAAFAQVCQQRCF